MKWFKLVMEHGRAVLTTTPHDKPGETGVWLASTYGGLPDQQSTTEYLVAEGVHYEPLRCHNGSQRHAAELRALRVFYALRNAAKPAPGVQTKFKRE